MRMFRMMRLRFRTWHAKAYVRKIVVQWQCSISCPDRSNPEHIENRCWDRTKHMIATVEKELWRPNTRWEKLKSIVLRAQKPDKLIDALHALQQPSARRSSDCVRHSKIKRSICELAHFFVLSTFRPSLTWGHLTILSFHLSPLIFVRSKDYLFWWCEWNNEWSLLAKSDTTHHEREGERERERTWATVCPFLFSGETVDYTHEKKCWLHAW